MWQWHKDRHLVQRNKDPEINPSADGQITFHKEEDHSKRKQQSCQRGKLDIHVQKAETGP